MEVSAASEKVYYKITSEKAPIYKRVGNKLVTVGNLYQNEVFPRLNNFGNWHEIQLGNTVGYIKKAHTSLVKASKGREAYIEDIEIKILKDTEVYDNSTGKLISFASLNEGSTYQISKDYGNWYEVTVSDRVGYIKKSDVQLQYTDSIDYFKVEADEVPVYVREKKRLKIVGYLTKNLIHRRVKDYGNWHEIQYNGNVAYVHKNYTLPILKTYKKNETTTMGQSSLWFSAKEDLHVYDNSTGKLIPYAKIKRGETYRINKDFGNWYEIILANQLGYIKKDLTTLQFTTGIEYFKVEQETAVYKQGNNRLIKVATLRKDEEYPIVEDYGNWHKVQLNNDYGFVKKRDTSPILTSNIKNEMRKDTIPIGTIEVKNETSVYDNTSGKLVSFMELTEGQTFEVLDYGKWIKIKILDRVGYIFNSDVTFMSFLDTMLKQNKVKSSQMIIVEAATFTNIKASLSLYEKQGDEWKKILSVPAVVGKNGMSMNKSEGDGRSPMGLFPIRGAFGTKDKPSGVDYSYRKTTTNDYWIDDANSPDYNKKVTYHGNPSLKWNSYEKLANSLYRHAVIIGYNDNPIVKGKGSAIFLHVWRSSSSPTLGCVAVSENNLVEILRDLDAEKNPYILIGTKASIPTF